MKYNYSGNIWELENIIDHAVAVTNTNILTEEHLPAHVGDPAISEEVKLFEKTAPGGEVALLNAPVSIDGELATHEKCLLLAALKKANGVQKRAAELLGINYRSFRHRLEKYGLVGHEDNG
jgi:two-component system response regulator PilR (NtrC family)